MNTTSPMPKWAEDATRYQAIRERIERTHHFLSASFAQGSTVESAEELDNMADSCREWQHVAARSSSRTTETRERTG